MESSRFDKRVHAVLLPPCAITYTNGLIKACSHISNQDEDTSTAASGSAGDTNLNVPENATSSKNTVNQHSNAAASTSQPISIPHITKPSSSSDPLSDLQ
ncbi:14794_t:CDS:2, partial [Acaulospora colombiana]